jgi:uncharacterized membrane protein YtjA (UPF0391 family)
MLYHALVFLVIALIAGFFNVPCKRRAAYGNASAQAPCSQ